MLEDLGKDLANIAMAGVGAVAILTEKAVEVGKVCAEKGAETLEKGKAASEELSSQAVMMKQELQRFKLRGQADDDMPVPVQTPAPAPVSEAPASSYTAPRSYGDKY